jgi:UDP-N-acetylglucosamine 2-epimerase (non-hydrolysing)
MLNRNTRCLFIFGTRPEAIKMAPLIKTFEQDEAYHVKVCVTAQHREMLDQVMIFFSINSDYDLNVMMSDQSLYGVTSRIIEGLKPVMAEYQPDYVFVQGDTTSTFMGALAAYYSKAKIVHVEAGLRTGDKYSPYPEEMNRTLVGRLADYHFAPTMVAKECLISEGVTNGIHVVGNTVVDALMSAQSIIEEKGLNKLFNEEYGYLDSSKKMILVTGHRRESFGEPFQDMCRAIRDLVLQNDGLEVLYPVHLNPNVKKPVHDILGSVNRVHLIEPVDYSRLVWLMSRSYFIMTDSGGIQEEAPSLGKPVLVMREVTERQEGVDAGTAELVGTRYESIYGGASKLLKDKDKYNAMSKAHNPYGDGKSSERIVNIIKQSDCNKDEHN